MATQKRTYESLKDHLFNAFYQFTFFQAVDLIESFAPSDRQQLSRTLLSNADENPLIPNNETIRFTVRPDFSFQISQISDLNEQVDSPTMMQVPFMGLIGPSGVLPDWYHQLAYRLDTAHKAKNHDYPSAMTAFFDLFHHRLITLFYLSWKKHRIYQYYQPDGSDKYSKYFLFLSGFVPQALSDKQVPLNPMIFLGQLISRHSSTANTLKKVLSYLTNIDVHIEQFIPTSMKLQPEDTTKIGTDHRTLGDSAICGSHVWDNQTKFRVLFNPQNHDEFQKLLPSSKNGTLKLVYSVIRSLSNPTYEFDIQIIIPINKLPTCKLGTIQYSLGWSSVLGSCKLGFQKSEYKQVKKSRLGWSAVLGKSDKPNKKKHSVTFSQTLL